MDVMVKVGSILNFVELRSVPFVEDKGSRLRPLFVGHSNAQVQVITLDAEQLLKELEDVLAETGEKLRRTKRIFDQWVEEEDLKLKSSTDVRAQIACEEVNREIEVVQYHLKSIHTSIQVWSLRNKKGRHHTVNTDECFETFGPNHPKVKTALEKIDPGERKKLRGQTMSVEDGVLHIAKDFPGDKEYDIPLEEEEDKQ